MRIVKILLLLSLVLTSSWAEPVESAFTGRWGGQWQNSAGESGEDNLYLEEADDGKLSGYWSDMAVTGYRQGDTITIVSSTDTRRYEGKGSVKDGILTIIYTATRLDSEGTYEGRSVFWHAIDCQEC